MYKKRIGMIVPTVDNSFFSSLAMQVERNMAQRGYQTILLTCDNSAEKEKEYYRMLEDAGTAGVISVSGLSELGKDLLYKDIPLVWVDRVPESDRQIPWVANDDAEAMETAVDHLIETGSRNILLLPGFLAEKQESPRVTGYKKALKKHGIAFRKEYVLNRQGKEASEKETGDLIRDIFLHESCIDGIITSSDRAAFGAITALQTIGYFVPEDVRLISFDNSTYSTMASPSITSLDRKTDKLAEHACHILEMMMKGQTGIRMETTVPVTLRKRDSTR